MVDNMGVGRERADLLTEYYAKNGDILAKQFVVLKPLWAEYEEKKVALEREYQDKFNAAGASFTRRMNDLYDEYTAKIKNLNS